MINCVKYIEVGNAVKILLHDCIRYVFPTTAEPTTEFIKLDTAVGLLQIYPSADVVLVVRCKDCKHWLKGDGSCFPHADYNDFCSNGERKDNE